MAAINYRCQHCDTENWTEQSWAGELRECRHCGRFGPVPSLGKTTSSSPTLKVCPYCAEKDLQPEAKVCKHCGKNLEGGNGCLLYLTVFLLVAGAAIFPPLILPGIALAVLWFIFRSL